MPIGRVAKNHPVAHPQGIGDLRHSQTIGTDDLSLARVLGLVEHDGTQESGESETLRVIDHSRIAGYGWPVPRLVPARLRDESLSQLQCLCVYDPDG
jgi:hypothetical protein